MLVDIFDGFQSPFAQVTRFVSVAKLHGLMFAGGCAGGNGGASYAAVGQMNVGFYRGIAAAVENFSTNDFCDFHRKYQLKWLSGLGASHWNPRPDGKGL